MHFLLADAFKPFVEKGNIQIYPSRDDFEKGYERLSRTYQAYSETELDKMIAEKDPVRLERYNSLDLYFGNANLSDIGPWPEMDGLNIQLTTGNLPEAVNRFRDAIKNNPRSLPDGFMPRIHSILNYHDLILNRFPIILFPGGVERGNHNDWVRTSGEIPIAQQREWICQIFKYDNDAGNSRAFAYCWLGLKEVPAYFGKKDNSALGSLFL